MSQPTSFSDLPLSKATLKTLKEIGYESPTPIQAECIPLLSEGRDIIGQAQTGTGKTAAFALPILDRISTKSNHVNVLVLCPTRELAIQVAEAFQKYAHHRKGFHVAPIYGGQDFSIQLRQLKRGVQIVVGTPGRVMDHMRRGSLDVSTLQCLVLDEADEMLRMGFIDDVEWIFEQIKSDHQTALFSATLPNQIRQIAKKYLNDPAEISIKAVSMTADTIEQSYWIVSHLHKLDALTRILEYETFDGMLIFVRTKMATAELAEKLEARGYNAVPLNGDIAQKTRERTINHLKQGKVDIVVATDVAARGLDVDRIDLVVNYDVPYDTESYIHRIGRTGRAGKTGRAILFISPREKRMLGSIEKASGKSIKLLKIPSTTDINNKRVQDFKDKITNALEAEQLGFFQKMVEEYQAEHNISGLEIAAALAKIAQGDNEFFMQEIRVENQRKHKNRDYNDKERHKKTKRKAHDKGPEGGFERYRIQVGSADGVKPGNIVGAIANESDLGSKNIGRINIFTDYSTVDLPSDMPKDVVLSLKKVWVANKQLDIKRDGRKQTQLRSR